MNLIKQLILSNSIDITTYDSYKNKLEGYLSSCQKKNKENTTNFLWRLVTLYNIKINFIKNFEHLKNGNFYESWCILETIEISVQNLINNSSKEFIDKYQVNFYKHYTQQWQSLFPYNIFFSMGFIASKFTCSICGHELRPRSLCNHRKGKIYDGELCFHICNQMDDILEVSIVDNPMQKCCIPMIDYDYSLVQYAVDRLYSPFDGWSYYKTKIKVERSKFHSVPPEDLCPCRENNKRFEECCFFKSQIEIPHIDFYFEKPFDESLPKFAFPY